MSLHPLRTPKNQPPSPALLRQRRNILQHMKGTTNLLDTCFTIPIPFPLSLAVKPSKHAFHNSLALAGLVSDNVLKGRHSRKSVQQEQDAVNPSSGPPARGRREFKGTQVQVGVQALVGLIPGLGDMVAFGLSLYPLVLARQLGMPTHLLIWMFINRMVVTVLGLIPFIGDLFIAMYKINLWSYRVAERWVEKEEKRARRSAPRTRSSKSRRGVKAEREPSGILATPSNQWYAESSDEDNYQTHDTPRNESSQHQGTKTHPPVARPYDSPVGMATFNSRIPDQSERGNPQNVGPLQSNPSDDIGITTGKRLFSDVCAADANEPGQGVGVPPGTSSNRFGRD
ncbi:hypothetical protein IWQ62_005703 [Dispira parvispora]|uniref:Uncharacterized protein n=1 Tax=Dispira parvispora TaxID=1520584 RepID=A0A9W8E4G4_9FUNG|nr:hypothetical protein IWQ62_005703 [Dispira parvispora]